ncbi:hypothetical protein GCM10009665_09210 [Kitasatospora nipponensis]|uniref:DUF4262 domain-containing protein n=1 Tax=Kitasatospora nipponensis TaxID=258049 RepID=A0ABP4GKF4_9ACTN
MDLPDCGCLLCDPPTDPAAWDARDHRIAENIREYDWHVNGVAGGDLPGDWSYSIGLWHTLRSPEVSFFGIPAQTGMRIVNVLADRIREGRPLEPDQRRDDVLGGGFAVAIRPVHPSWYHDFFGAGVDFYQRPPLPITQMFWPDQQGRFPWDDGVEESCRAAQPLLWIAREESSGPWVDEDPSHGWPFPTSLPFHEVLASPEVVSGDARVARATRSHSGQWHFHAEGHTADRLERTTLGHILAHHPDTRAIAWLTAGGQAVRDPDGSWPER